MRTTLSVLMLAALPGGMHSSISRYGDSPTPKHSYLFVWAGDTARKSSDFLAVIDADPASATYGRVVTSIATGKAGTPHHTEDAVAPNGHFLANDFGRGDSWLFDVNDPLHPRVLKTLGDVAGFSHPHSFFRFADGTVLATFQYKAGSTTASGSASAGSMPGMPGMKGMSTGSEMTGGLVHMDERGVPILARSARDHAISDSLLFPYSVVPIAKLDRAVSTTTNMDPASKATSQWVQIWRLSDLKLLRSIALSPGPRGKENQFTGEPRLLADGKSVYIHTFNCGLYLLRNVETDRPAATFVHGFEGEGCGVPILAGHYWLQTVPAAHALVTLDITEPEHPREVARVVLSKGERPHWIAIDPTGRRIALNSSGPGSRVYIIDFDRSTGKLALDRRFSDSGSDSAGVSMKGKSWPHGFTGEAIPHGSIFSR